MLKGSTLTDPLLIRLACTSLNFGPNIHPSILEHTTRVEISYSEVNDPGTPHTLYKLFDSNDKLIHSVPINDY